jgi:uncharacterized protein (DUF1499 family)
MAIRRIADQPMSRLAIWARRIALFSLAATLLAIVIVRSGMLEIVPALATFAGALSLAVVAILLAIAAGAVIWKEGIDGLGHAVTALLIGLAIIAYPTFLGLRAYKLPAIYDITTDPIDPPKFDAIARLRPRDANDIRYAGLYTAELQHAAYSDIEPDATDSTPQEAFDAALAVITKRKWRVVDARPPQPSARRDGIIEAVARTPLLGFRDDVVVRVRATTEGARIDVRSASRYGTHDFGANARRVTSLLSDIDDAMDAELSKPAAPEPKEEKEPARKRPAPKKKR